MTELYLGIKFHPDQRNKNTIEAICRCLDPAQYTCTCIVRDLEKWGQFHFEPKELMRRTFAIIDSSAAVIIDLSEKGVGLGIEAGYAHAKGIPVLTIAAAGSDISATLAGISSQCFLYENYSDLTPFFAERLAPLLLQSN